MFKLISIFSAIKGFSLRGFWRSHDIGGKIYLIFAALVITTVIVFLVKRILNSPKRKLNFVVNAQRNGCVEVGKLSCLTAHGYGSVDYYQAEYMYVVEGVKYFVTYEMAASLTIDNHKDEMNADMLLLKIKPFLLMYYDKANPKKVYSKMEIFTSQYAIKKVKTPKVNSYRDVNKEWNEPINLVQR